MNSWLIMAFIAGAPFILITPLLNYFCYYIPNYRYYDYVLFNVPHVFSGFAVAYLSEKRYKNPALFIAVPFVIFISTIFFYTLGYTFEIGIIRFYWGLYHILFQYHYLLGFFKLRNQRLFTADKILDMLVFIAGGIYLGFHYLYDIQSKLAAKWNFLKFSIDTHFLECILILAWLTGGCFLARQIICFFRWKQLFFFKILMVFNFYFLLMSTKNLPVSAYYRLIMLHSVQYISWVWLYHQNKFKGLINRETWFISFLSQRRCILLYLLFFISISMLYMIIVRSKAGLGRYFEPEAIIAGVALTHFFLDGIIWRRDPALKLKNL